MYARCITWTQFNALASTDTYIYICTDIKTIIHDCTEINSSKTKYVNRYSYVVNYIMTVTFITNKSTNNDY